MDVRKYRRSKMINVTIPTFYPIFNDSGKELYTVYKVHIAKPGGGKDVEKRYSDFRHLHKTLKMNHELPQGQDTDFPPKKLNPSEATKKERRTKLETYMKVLCNQDPISTNVLAFLGISLPKPTLPESESDHMNNTSSCEDLLAVQSSNTHQPVMGFLRDPFAPGQQQQTQSLDNDVLLDGILDGLYLNSTSNSVNGVC